MKSLLRSHALRPLRLGIRPFPSSARGRRSPCLWARVLLGTGVVGFLGACQSPEPMPELSSTPEPGIFANPMGPAAPPASLRPASTGGAGEPLTLNRVVDLALRNNPEVRLAWLQARNQEARLGEAEADLFPSLRLSGRGRRDDQGSSGGLQSFRQTSYDLVADLSYTLYEFGGSRRDNITAAERALDASLFQYNRKMQDIVLQAQRAYYNLHEKRAEIQAAQQSVEEAQTAADAATQLFEAGTGTIQDTFRANSRLEQTRFDLERSRSEYEDARADLALLLGMPVSSGIRVTDPNPLRIDPETWASVQDLMAESMRNRADRLARLATLESDRARAEAALGQQLPRLLFSGQGEIQWIDGTQQTSWERLDDYTVGLTLQWDAFDGFRKRYQWLAARNEARQAAQQLREDELRISSEVWKSFYGLRSSRAQLESARAVEQASRKTFQASQASYRAGTTDLLHLLTAQKDLAEARSQRIAAEAALAETVAELLHAIAAPDALQSLVPDADRFSGTILFLPRDSGGRVIPGR